MHLDHKMIENILQKCSNGIAIISKQGVIKYLSPAVEKMFGYNKSELSTVNNWINLTSSNEKDKEQAAKDCANDIVLEAPPERLYQIIRKDGIKRWCRFQMSKLENEEILISIQDVTVIKESEESAKDVVEKYTSILDNLGDAIHVINRDFKILYINRTFNDWCDALGLGYEYIGKSIFDVFSFLPDTVRDEYEHIFENGEVLVSQETNSVSGNEIATETRKIPVLNDGEVAQIITVIKDITHSKKIEETLKEAEEKYQMIFESAGIPILIIEEDTTISLVNKEFERFSGYTKEEIEGKKSWTEFILKEDLEKLNEYHVKRRQAEKTDIPTKYECRGRLKDNVIRNIYMSVDVIPGTNKSIASVLDITNIKEAEASKRESSQLLKIILDNIPQRIFWKDRNSVYLGCNKTFADDAGLNDPEEIIGKTDYDMPWKKEETAFYLECDKRVMNSNTPEYNIIEPQLHADGTEAWLDTNRMPLHDKEGNVTAVIGTYEDITDRKKNEEKLRRSYSLIDATLESTADGILAVNLRGKILNYNKKFKEMWTIPQKTLDSRDENKVLNYVLCQLKEPESFLKRVKHSYLYISKDSFDSFELNDGRVFERFSKPQRIDDKVVGRVWSFRDVTMRKKAEKISEIQRNLGIELSTTTSVSKAMRQLLKTIINLEEIDCGGVYFINKNDGSLKMIFSTGLSPEFSDSVSYYDKNAPETQLVVKGKPVYMQYQKSDFTKQDKMRLKEGLRGLAVIPIKHEKNIISVINIGSHTVDDFSHSTRLAIETIASQIGGAIARINLQEALLEEKELLDITLRSIGDGVITTDTKGSIVLINKVAEVITGYKNKDVTGKYLKDIFELLDPNDRTPIEDPVSKVLKSKSIVSLSKESLLFSKDGTERLIADSGAPIKDKRGDIRGVVIVFRDITKKRKTEQELQKAQKLESIGILAGGIAHDFNNILTAIVGSIYLAKTFVDPKDEIFEVLVDAEKASLQAKNLTQQLLTFSRGGLPIKKTISINEVVKESIGFSLRGSNLKCKYDMQVDIWNVRVDPGQISQVISNLVINAEQAMPEGGEIIVSTKNISVTKNMKIPLKEGQFVKLSIQDKGIGVSKEHLNKIFDPFFTTKQKGSGLGLAISYSIIKKHSGVILVDSKIGKGTTFNIYLPVSDKKVQALRKPKGKDITGEGRILLVDDEDMILRVGKKLLKYLGYEVDVTTDGAKAIEIYEKERKSGRPFDVIIIDLTIPGGMGGKETIKRLIKIDPDVKMIVSSGYSQDVIMSQYKDYGFCGIITKPYSIDDVSATLSKVIKS